VYPSCKFRNIVQPTTIQLAGTILFGLAVLHTFSVKRFQHIATGYPAGSIGENFFHWLGEVEAVFGLWAGLLILFIAFSEGREHVVTYLDGLNFTEPMFVFVIMTMAATRPILLLAGNLINFLSKLLPLPRASAIYLTTLIVGPLLGSVVTEPAAMTLTALILRDRFFQPGLSAKAMYLTLGVLFVNVSIGGVLTPFAAPPVIMVAGPWQWDLGFMLTHFGGKAVLAVVVNALFALAVLHRELKVLPPAPGSTAAPRSTPGWLVILHLGFLGLVVAFAHHKTIFGGLFLFFLAVTNITAEHQDDLKIRESLLVAFFLAGLVVLGGFQHWWLQPAIQHLTALPLFLGATLGTAIIDNAALTFLGTQITGISDELKYALVAGAVTGGGLTVIANAPNPAGFSILKESFGPEGISPVTLFLAAVIPTLVALLTFWFL
jgi:hypothetical protein